MSLHQSHRLLNSENRELQPLTCKLPEEVVIYILSYVDPKTLVTLRLVCHSWMHFIDSEVWRLKLSRKKYTSLTSLEPKKKLPWFMYYSICVKDPFQRNLVKNNCGQKKLKYWKVIECGGNGWRIQKPPSGVDCLPAEEEFSNHNSCFVTSFEICSKEQVVSLVKNGLSEKILDEVKPYIEVSEWYAGRSDCGCRYKLEVGLLDSYHVIVENFKYEREILAEEGRTWYKVSHVFKDYSSGVRYVRFYHEGVDTRWWRGHYGSKMSGACVKLLIPPDLSSEEYDCCRVDLNAYL